MIPIEKTILYFWKELSDIDKEVKSQHEYGWRVESKEITFTRNPAEAQTCTLTFKWRNK